MLNRLKDHWLQAVRPIEESVLLVTNARTSMRSLKACSSDLAPAVFSEVSRGVRDWGSDGELLTAVDLLTVRAEGDVEDEG
ncbi:uncharacterized protein MELLADRAFT_71319 [Melampsora larici-populina 98AG31]|uniref:Uncharacterized protein n=1 Tax=Melampsora larici-populina (strain 98AG31 / pathotype 3-4-7) TaxID=747676 RepID=F4REY7_MELLP|nr:uncharacterized protein MELLADRAFT_71319 [Melampsora larici-populina 98AG31]EGG09204.1 hypothetical protein MELLADRAFT_71319 [Melampsora larici-populina 98AG31]